MRTSETRFFMRGWLAALAALAFAACGGGGGNSGVGAASLNSTSTQAATQELVNAFGATLTGAEETPPHATNAEGTGTAVVNANTRELLAVVRTSGIAGTAAHIHQAAPGQPGPIIIPMSEALAGSGIWIVRTTLTEDQFNNLKAGNLYFNVHSAAFPDGEIRGQIGSQSGATTTVSATSFVSSLKGSQEVPPTPSAAQASGNLVVDASSRRVAAVILTSGIVGTAAHIHEGAPGVSGPIIVPMSEVLAGSGLWVGSGVLSEAQYNSLQQGNLYFNVHSAAFPDGEIRGQILPQQQFTATITPPATTTTGSPSPTTGMAAINPQGY